MTEGARLEVEVCQLIIIYLTLKNCFWPGGILYWNQTFKHTSFTLLHWLNEGYLNNTIDFTKSFFHFQFSHKFVSQ